MATLLLSCDDYVYCCKGRYYARSQEKYDFYQRYLRVFDKIKLVTRCACEDTLSEHRVAFDDERIEYIPIPSFHGPKQYAKVYLKIERTLRDITVGCDAAILRLPSTIAQRVCKKVMKSGIPYATELVFDAHDAFDSAATTLGKLLWRIIDKQMTNACNNADGVACVTEHYLQTHYSSKKPDAFYEHYSSLAMEKSFYSGARRMPKNKRMTIAHVCNQVQFNGRKGCNEVIAAIKLLKERGVDIKVNFAGPDYRDGIRKLTEYATLLGVEDRVTFIGGVNREQLSEYLEKSDMYVMPTRAEGLPRVIIEAMAKGLPCITTPVSGNPELVDEHFLVEYSDVKTLADRIEELCKDAKLYERTSQINFERSKKYEASILQARRDDFYKKLKGRMKG